MVKRSVNYFHKSEEIQHKSFWAALAIIFLISAVTIITLTEKNILTGKIIQGIGYMPAGKELFFEIKDVDGLQYGNVEIKETIKDGKIIFQQDNTIKFSGETYSKFKVSSPDTAKLGGAVYTLKITQEKLQFPKEELTVYANGKIIPITYTSADERYYYFTTQESPFEEGNYIIGRKMAEVKKEVPTPIVVEIAVEVPVVQPEPIVEETPVEPVVEQPSNVVGVSGEAVGTGDNVKVGLWQKIKAFLGFN